MSNLSIIEFKKTKEEITEKYREMVDKKSIPDVYKNVDVTAWQRAYVPIYLFDGKIDGSEMRNYMNKNTSVTVLPGYASVSRTTSYNDVQKTGHAEFQNYPLVINRQFKDIFESAFSCEQILEPYNYEEAKEIDDLQNAEELLKVDFEDEQIENRAKEKMENILAKRLFGASSGSCMAMLGNYLKRVTGKVVYVPVYFIKAEVNGVGIFYVIGNGQTGEVYMNILERIDGYGILGKLANAAITIAGVAAALVGYLIAEAVSFTTPTVIILIMALIGAVAGHLIGNSISYKIVEHQINSFKKRCINNKNIEYLNSGYEYVVPNSMMVR